MSLYENVYSESVKDIIGNDPVLDQFDIFYEASYYGTMQDDYITGSLINKLTNPNAPMNYTLATGSRGRVLSKLYAGSHPPLNTTFGSDAVRKIPSLSFRIIPWTNRVSRTAFRLSQAFDANERYYDSCLPDLNNCFSANGSKPWSIKNITNTTFSPYGNYQSGSNDVFLIFNYLEKEVPGYEKDPTVDNEWTWSFPYETKYSPEKRILRTDSSFGLNQNVTTADLELVEPLDIYNKNYEVWETSVQENIDVKNVTQTNGKVARTFKPLLPGLNSTSNIRNSFRQTLYTPIAGGLGSKYILPTSYEDPELDKIYGYSFLIPSDVNLIEKGDHTFLSKYSVSDPGDEALTGSMFPSDTIKFLFGFGDLNTITYNYRIFEPNNARVITEGFESYSDGTTAPNISSYSIKGFNTRWSNDPTNNGWIVREKQGQTTPPGGVLSWFFSGQTPAISSVGVHWTKDDNNKKILFSDTIVDFGGNISNSGGDSITYLHITSSYPWSLKFDFSVAADMPNDYLHVSVEGDDANFDLIQTNDDTTPDLFFRSNGSAGGRDTFVKLPGELKTGYSTGGTYDWEVHGAKDTGFGGYFNGSKDYPIPAGKYRIKFHYQTEGLAGTVAFAAIDNLAIKLYDDACFPPDTTRGKMGGNNYPEFRRYVVDSREDPTYSFKVPSDWGSQASILQDKTSMIYSGIHYGISPIIRGWKYGLISGFPQHTKTIFRRGRYGQLRDMLEQRQYTRFISVNSSPVDYEAITVDGLDKTLNGGALVQGSSNFSLNEPPVSVKFIKKIVKISPRKIGTIETIPVNPTETTSQNLSTEVTSSLPYFDNTPRHRSIEEMMTVKRSSYVDTVITTTSDSELGNI